MWHVARWTKSSSVHTASACIDSYRVGVDELMMSETSTSARLIYTERIGGGTVMGTPRLVGQCPVSDVQSSVTDVDLSARRRFQVVKSTVYVDYEQHNIATAAATSSAAGIFFYPRRRDTSEMK